MRWVPGLCVLSSDVAENREAVEDAGFTFRRGDAADLADRLRFLIANPAVREAAGQAAKRRIREHYQWPQIAQADRASVFRNDGLGIGGDWSQKAGSLDRSRGVRGAATGGIRRRRRLKHIRVNM